MQKYLWENFADAMDELAALRLIFRQHLTQEDGVIRIKCQDRTYEIDAASMQIIAPAHEYADIYDYILRDRRGDAVEAAKTSEIDAALKEVDRITEEQFYCWKNSRASGGSAREHALSGKELWLLQRVGEISEQAADTDAPAQ